MIENMRARDLDLQFQINKWLSEREHYRKLRGRKNQAAARAADQELKSLLKQSDALRARIKELSGT